MRSIYWIALPLAIALNTAPACSRAAIAETSAFAGGGLELAGISRSGSRWRLSRAHPHVVGRARADVEEADRRRPFVVRGRRRPRVHHRATQRQRGRGRVRRDDRQGAVDQRVAGALQPVDGRRRRSPGDAGLGRRPRLRARRRGELRCLDAATGQVVWRTNILQDAGAKNLRWGMAASPLIAGDAVIVLPGGPKRAIGRGLRSPDGQAVVDGARRQAGLRLADARHASRRPAVPGRQRRDAWWD